MTSIRKITERRFSSERGFVRLQLSSWYTCRIIAYYRHARRFSSAVRFSRITVSSAPRDRIDGSRTGITYCPDSYQTDNRLNIAERYYKKTGIITPLVSDEIGATWRSITYTPGKRSGRRLEPQQAPRSVERRQRELQRRRQRRRIEGRERREKNQEGSSKCHGGDLLVSEWWTVAQIVVKHRARVWQGSPSRGRRDAQTTTEQKRKGQAGRQARAAETRARYGTRAIRPDRSLPIATGRHLVRKRTLWPCGPDLGNWRHRRCKASSGIRDAKLTNDYRKERASVRKDIEAIFNRSI